MSTLAIITGASRGLGRRLAIEMAATFSPLHTVLFSRSKEGLESTKVEIEKGPSKSTVEIHPVDFAHLDSLPTSLEEIFKQLALKEYKKIYFILNHGSLGPLKYIKQQTDFKAVRAEIDLNVTSVYIATSIFLKHFEDKKVPTVLVNVSSLAALQPFDSWSIYCMGKAGREMIFKAVPVEVESHVKTLNYAPGPCDTDMQKEIRETAEGPSREVFKKQYEEGKLLDPALSMKLLVSVLEKDEFKSGSHIDIYDVIDTVKK